MPSIEETVKDSDNVPPSLFGSSNFFSSSSSMCIENSKCEHLMKIIKDKPKLYLGIPKNFWWIIEYLEKEHSCKQLYTIVTLFKIKNNDTFVRISDQFQLARSTVKLQFEKHVQILATFFQNFIYLPSPLDIKQNLPLVFKIRYSNVQLIIDCFEIQIQKPSNPVRQAQTWSQYKSCNTVKYLIGCTPAGLICYISKGYGGRISDKAIIEQSDFIDILPTNCTIMADRGFKEAEALLSTKNIKILRPPSVFTNQKPTKQQVIETKVIASLRVHVERVIRRIREFHILKPHSVVNYSHIKYLDHIVIIASGLVNLQEALIKDY